MEDYLFGSDWGEPFVMVRSVPELRQLLIIRTDTKSFFRENQQLVFSIGERENVSKLHKVAVSMVEAGLIDWSPGARNNVEVIA